MNHRFVLPRSLHFRFSYFHNVQETIKSPPRLAGFRSSTPLPSPSFTLSPLSSQYQNYDLITTCSDEKHSSPPQQSPKLPTKYYPIPQSQRQDSSMVPTPDISLYVRRLLVGSRNSNLLTVLHSLLQRRIYVSRVVHRKIVRVFTPYQNRHLSILQRHDPYPLSYSHLSFNP